MTIDKININKFENLSVDDIENLPIEYIQKFRSCIQRYETASDYLCIIQSNVRLDIYAYHNDISYINSEPHHHIYFDTTIPGYNIDIDKEYMTLVSNARGIPITLEGIYNGLIDEQKKILIETFVEKLLEEQ